jgi:hypothetical protein
MNDLKEYLKRRISRMSKRVESVKEKYGDNPTETYNFYGGQTLGHWQGMLSAYENVLDEIEELENK